MTQRIEMGNDEFILYIRKRYPANRTPNNQLGKRIWQWIRDQAPSNEKPTDNGSMPCVWGSSGSFVGETALPANATQFTFDRALLPALYTFLDALGSANGALEEALSVFDAPSRRVIDALLGVWPWQEPRVGEREVMLDTTDPEIHLKFAPYAESGTGQHVVIWAGPARVKRARALVEARLGQGSVSEARTESVNIPLSKLEPAQAAQLIEVVRGLLDE